MEGITFLLFIYFILYVYACVYVSSFFRERSIHRVEIFFISLIATPITGAIIGSSASKQLRKYSPDLKKNIELRNLMIKEIEILHKEKELGLLNHSGEKRLQNILDYYRKLDLNNQILK